MSNKCPYLIETRRQRIFCRGLVDNMTLSQGFSSSLDQKEYLQQYCHGCYPLCPLAQAIDPALGLIVCPHNDAVDCLDHSCDRCGWNPAVAADRLVNIRQRLYTEQGGVVNGKQK